MKIIIRIIIVISAIVILSLILLPGIAKKYASKHSKELVGRQIVIDKLRINYFTGTLKVTDFKMFEEDDNNVFVSFDTLIINLEPYQLFVDEFVIEQLYLKGLKASVTQQDSMFNFDDLIAFNINESDTVEVDPILTEPLHFQLSNIELKDAEFIFDDRIINKITKLNEI